VTTGSFSSLPGGTYFVGVRRTGLAKFEHGIGNGTTDTWDGENLDQVLTIEASANWEWCREGESNPQGPKPGGF
jgi:hypothetical protein